LTKPSLYVGIREIWDFLYKKFKINHNKTYVPCDFNKLTKDELVPIAIGFIDGDGSINKRGYITIKVHKNWEENIIKMLSPFTDKFNKIYTPYYDGNLVSCHVTDIEITKYIKNLAINLKLPILKRKWNNISFEKLSQKENCKKNLNICKLYYKKGISVKELIKITGLSESVIYKNIKILKKEGCCV